MKQIQSFDVFDTVLTRAVGDPAALFLLLGRRLSNRSLIPCTPEAFARARVDSERRASLNAPGGHVSLAQVYMELGSRLYLDDAQRAAVLESEYELEAELIRPVPGAADRISAARAARKQIVFISDMYLPACFIRTQLSDHRLWEEGDALHVSCETGKWKTSGELFRAMLEHHHTPASAAVHSGNDYRADIEAPRRLGIRVESLSNANLNRYERILESHLWATEGLSSLMAGASRLARLRVHTDSAREATLCEVAAGVAAPTLVGYVLWILHTAQRFGLERLYFVSRDGQILLKIAKRLAEKVGFACEMRYLYGSRQAWHLPGLTQISETELSWILDPSPLFSVRSVLARVRLDPDQVRDELFLLGFDRSDWDRNLDHKEQGSLRYLFEAERVKRLIMTTAEIERELTTSYLKQEGLLESVRKGIVEIGWHGRLQNSLSAILRAAGGSPPMGLYFGLHKHEFPSDSGPRESYFFDGRYSYGYMNLMSYLECLLEIFCSADHGRTVGYASRQGRIDPILKEERNEQLISWGLLQVQRSVVTFVEELILDPSLINCWADVRPAIAEVLWAFWQDPSKSEAVAWGTFPYEDDQAGAYRKCVANCYSWLDVAHCLLLGHIRSSRQSLWNGGAQLLTAKPIRVALKCAIRSGNVRRRCASRFKREVSALLERGARVRSDVQSIGDKGC
jgi:FMN phosphatase YigB (HAD superfamily)